MNAAGTAGRSAASENMLSRQQQTEDQKSYSGYVYMWEDNYFLTPLNMNAVFLSKNKTFTKPYVIIDEDCTFRSYSDKMYISNELGADLLFGRSRAQFLLLIKLYVLTSNHKKDVHFEPMQPEAFFHDVLGAAQLERVNLGR
jgi:hypothetical protein